MTTGIENTKVELIGDGGQQIKLTPQQQEAFNKYLTSLESKGTQISNTEKFRKKTIGLTKTELDELQKLISTQPQDDAAIINFFEKQEKETITLDEYLAKENPELLFAFDMNPKSADMLKNITKKMNKGIPEINIDVALRFSTNTMLYILEDNKIANIIQDISKENPQDKETVLQLFKTKLDEVFDMGSIQKIDKVIHNLPIENGGENIPAFNDKAETKRFYEFAKGKTEQQIKDYLLGNPQNEDNTASTEHSQSNSDESSDESNLTTGVENIVQKFEEVEKTFEGFTDKIVKQVTGNKELMGALGALASAPIIGDIIKGILSFFGIDNIDELLNNQNFEAIKKDITENINAEGTIFASKKIPDNFMKNDDGGNDTLFLTHIQTIIGDTDNFGEAIKKLFTDSELSSFLQDSEVLDKIGYTSDSNNINYTNLKKGVILYNDYQIAKKENSSLTFSEFLSKKDEAIQENDNLLKQVSSGDALATAAATTNPEEDSKSPQKTEDTPTAQQSVQENESHGEGETVEINNDTEESTDTSKDNTKNNEPKEETVSEKNDTQISKNKTDTKVSETNPPANAIQKENNQTADGKTEVNSSNGEEKNKQANEIPQKNNFEINEPKEFEIQSSKIVLVFDKGGKIYKAQLVQGTENFGLILTGNGEKKGYNVPQEIFDKLQSYRGRLEEKATVGDFDDSASKYLLNGHTIQDILLNGLHEYVGNKLLGKTVDSDGLIHILSNNFFDGEKMKGGSVSINFLDKNYTLTELEQK